MSSQINIELNGFDELKKLLDEEPQRIIKAMIQAQIKVGTEGVNHLKRGLSHQGGTRGQKNARKGGSDPYVTSPKGSLPYRHTGGLQRSIGLKNLANNTTVWTKIGSGINAPEVEYAKYLEGHNHDGIRPFLQALKDVVTSRRIIEYFNKYYKPLSGEK